MWAARMADEPPPFLDTNILIYALGEAGPKSDRALAAIEAGGVISVQVLNEMTNVLRRKRGLEWEAVADILDLARGLLRVVPLTLEAQAEAVRVARRTGYSIWDATILAAAAEAGCAVLLSEDMADGHDVGGVTIRNPFAGM